MLEEAEEVRRLWETTLNTNVVTPQKDELVYSAWMEKSEAQLHLQALT